MSSSLVAYYWRVCVEKNTNEFSAVDSVEYSLPIRKAVELKKHEI